ncbi:DUF4861 family protein [Olivibacter domesticus]|uniref:DUF4861 domain-containing protein n=1 Tax=Olivibacter domesticus TaxID=407022 RepID=A0A1H7TG93_OLID1|nr:DUF4861 family protein [Olivibacter domesticus]SEL83912.1 protein of unknown function [Olivibacter domesticus]
MGKIEKTGYLGTLIALMSLILMSCNTANKHNKTIIIANPSNVKRAEVASIPFQAFKQAYNHSNAFKIIDEQGKECSYQLEKLGTDSIANVLIWVEIPANSEVQLTVDKGEPAKVRAKTFARYVPERFDDFAWENDKIAFRMYGKALEGRPDDAQGTDIWAKRTDALVVDEWYKTGDYHKDHGKGLDYYSVGMTLGAGDIAPFVKDRIIYSKHYRQHEILDNGPLRSTFKLTFEPWDVGGKAVSVTKTITLDAGSQLNKVEVVYDYDGEEALPVVAGIVLRDEAGETIEKAEQGLMAYWEPTHGADGTLGVGVLTAEPVKKSFKAEGQLLSLLSASKGKPLIYYNGGAWDKAGNITSAKAWEEYLLQYQHNLKNPLKVSIK